MRYSKRAVALFVVLAVAGHATAQHKGDPRLDELARQYEARFKSVEARLDALEGKRAMAAPVAAPMTYEQPVVYQMPMMSFGEGGSVCGPGGCGPANTGRRGLFGRRR